MSRLLSLVVAALSISVLLAPSAFAQASVQILDEDTMEPCDPCVFHAIGNSSFTFHYMGSMGGPYDCEDEFEGEIFAEADPEDPLQQVGHIYDWENTHPMDPTDCIHVPCVETAENERPLEQASETGPGEVHLRTEFCIRTEGSETEWHCAFEVHMRAVNGHVTEITADNASGPFGPIPGFTCRYNADWDMEIDAAHEGLYIEHL